MAAEDTPVKIRVDLKTAVATFGDGFKAELSEFLDDWAQSDLRVTHGRASSEFECNQLSTSVQEWLEQAIEELNNDPTKPLYHKLCSARYGLVSAALKPSFYAFVSGYVDVNFEILHQACARLQIYGQRRVAAFPEEDIRTFLKNEFIKKGEAPSPTMR